MKISEPNKSKIKQYAPWVLLLVIIVFSLFGGKKYFDDTSIYEKKLDSINDIQVLKEEQFAKQIEEKEIYIEEVLNQKEQTYYDEYINERNRRVSAEKKLGAIGNLVFNKRYLDSLAEHVTY